MTDKHNGVRDPKQMRAKSSKFGLSDHGFTRFYYVMDVEEEYENALEPEYWAGLANQLQKNMFSGQADRSGAIIELRSEDHSFYAELYVRAVNPSELVVAPVREPVYFGKPGASKENESYKRRWNVGNRSYEVQRVSDGAVVGRGFKIPEDADTYISQMK